MSKVKVELNNQGIQALLKSNDMANMIQSCINKGMSHLDSSLYVGDVQVHHRAVGMIKCANMHGYYHELKHNDLLKAMGAAKP